MHIVGGDRGYLIVCLFVYVEKNVMCSNELDAIEMCSELIEQRNDDTDCTRAFADDVFLTLCLDPSHNSPAAISWLRPANREVRQGEGLCHYRDALL
jgi:hypothetical protein